MNNSGIKGIIISKMMARSSKESTAQGSINNYCCPIEALDVLNNPYVPRINVRELAM